MIWAGIRSPLPPEGKGASRTSRPKSRTCVPFPIASNLSSQSRRDCVLQPRVGSNELPWVNCVVWRQPQRGCGLRSPITHRNPVGVERAPVPFPRVARSSQPRALSRNPVGIRLLNSSCASRLRFQALRAPKRKVRTATRQFGLPRLNSNGESPTRAQLTPR
jgi:hypothetical protein